MKVLAVILSPLGGVLFILLLHLLWSAIFTYDFLSDIRFAIPIVGYSYVVGLIIQITIVETIMSSNDFLSTLKGYNCLAFFLSFCFATIISVCIGIEYITSFFIFFIYSVGNILTYNQLYFKYL